MAQFEIRRVIHAPKKAVWDKLSDVGNVSIFHPMVEKSSLIGGGKCGLGAKRVCNFYNGKGYVEEEVTGWNEGQSLSIAIRKGTMPLKTAVVHFDLREVTANSTSLTMAVVFEVKWGLLGLMITPMMKIMMKKMLGGVLDGLETHLKTGRHIGLDGKLDPIRA